MFESERIHNIGSYHAAIGFHSAGEAVHLLETEPWQVATDEEVSIFFHHYLFPSSSSWSLPLFFFISKCPCAAVFLLNIQLRLQHILCIFKTFCGIHMLENQA